MMGSGGLRLRCAIVLWWCVACLAAAPASAQEWLAGDLHVHTWHSHDSWRGPGEDDHNTDESEFSIMLETWLVSQPSATST